MLRHSWGMYWLLMLASSEGCGIGVLLFKAACGSCVPQTMSAHELVKKAVMARCHGLLCHVGLSQTKDQHLGRIVEMFLKSTCGHAVALSDCCLSQRMRGHVRRGCTSTRLAEPFLDLHDTITIGPIL